MDAFGSITVHDSGGCFASNPIGRCAIGNRHALQYNTDGSLGLYIQTAAPRRRPRAELAPFSKDAFSLSMGLYGSRPAILNGSWTPPLWFFDSIAQTIEPIRPAERMNPYVPSRVLTRGKT